MAFRSNPERVDLASLCVLPDLLVMARVPATSGKFLPLQLSSVIH
jgi:hypothetical protein